MKKESKVTFILIKSLWGMGPLACTRKGFSIGTACDDEKSTVEHLIKYCHRYVIRTQRFPPRYGSMEIKELFQNEGEKEAIREIVSMSLKEMCG